MQQLVVTVSYSTILLRTKIGNAPEPNPLAASFGIRTVWTWLSHQPISIAPSCPQESDASADALGGTVTLMIDVVVGTRLTCRSGLSPDGFVCERNSALRKTLTNWPVPTAFPPQV